MAIRRDWTDITELSEHELRVQVIIPILVATDGLSGITDVHGRNEKGLDVLFIETGSIEKLCYGLQLKAGNIAGGGTGSGTVKEIVDQLQLAKDLSHPIPVAGQGRVQIDRYIVATSGRISETAREEIVGRVGRIPVVFWDGTEILRRIRKQIPELFNTSDGISVTYLKALIARYQVLDSLDVVQGVATRTLEEVYEPPMLKRKFDPSVGDAAGKTPHSNSLPALDLLESKQSAVVIADQDGGKTALLRMLAIQRAKAILSGDKADGGTERPIFVRAKDIVADGYDLVACSSKELARNFASPLIASITDDLKEGTYILLIDGFSEIISEEEKVACEEAIQAFRKDYQRCRMVVTGRPVDFLVAKYFSNLRHYVVEEFNQSQVASLLHKWTNDTPALSDVARKLIKRVREALQLPGSPISATIGVMLFEKEHRYITNIAEAVDRYMVIRLGRYSQELGIRQEIEWTRKQDLLAELAYRMIHVGAQSADRADVVGAFNLTFDRLGEDLRGERVLEELLESGILDVEGGRVVFHRSAFRDFFAAHSINQMVDRDTFFRRVLLDRRWGLALVFAAGLRRKNTELLQDLIEDVEALKKNAIGEPSADYFYSAYLIGRILSNSESTDKSARISVIKTCLTASIDSLPEFVKTATKEFGNIGELAALMGIEHSFFSTVGVPWLQAQFKSLLSSKDLSDEEKYLLAATIANLGCEKCFELIEKALGETDSTRVLLVLRVLLWQLRQERKLSGEDKKTLTRLENRIRRRLSKPERSKEAKRLVEMKSKIIQMEMSRMRRLEAGEKKQT
jgi:hypothetical protein